MKNRLLCLIVSLVCAIGYAQSNDSNQTDNFKCGSLKTTFNKEVIEYKFKSLEDLTDQIGGIIEELVFNNPENIKEVCELIVELKLEIIIGATIMVISEKITTGCGNETRLTTIRKFKALIYAAIG